jgi:two-component system phosphate regulon sensor histidine kinase PhoR
LPVIQADPKLIHIILQNLLSNSIKYTPEKGTITVSLSVKQSNMVIEVQDTGYGIPKGDQSKIYSKLFRADNVKAKETEGTGLGLYIVKSIIDNSGGTIDFSSAENKGTHFTIILPLTGMKKKSGSKELSTDAVSSKTIEVSQE